MSLTVLRLIVSCVACLEMTAPAADEPGTAEVLRGHSPDKKFAMRIVCDAEHAKAKEIPAEAVRSVALVLLPAKTEVTSLLTEDALEGFGDLRLVWSADSQGCAFYSAAPRVGYTKVYRRNGDAFAQVEGELSVPDDVDTRNEYIFPVRWVKPGVLLLEQLTTARGNGADFHAQFTATFDARRGKFRIGGIKKLAK